MQKTTTVELANNVDSDEVAHNEPPHLNLHSLPTSLLLLKTVWMKLPLQFSRPKFIAAFFGALSISDQGLQQLIKSHVPLQVIKVHIYAGNKLEGDAGDKV